MPSNEKQLNETMSGQELKNELAQEVEKFKQSGDSLGFACDTSNGPSNQNAIVEQ
ncbi:hypothetical protein FOQG_18490 [Fusarium oxysporum f. sp. raphani 54005]|uniref:Uncharacterized protein n=2 Tax=Fusarium oxysporum TaxID=5507 RepID=X0BE89_FUSOX|nr:hypothetical protein FOXB_12462 [Fusarium oxysporum f. sp. conglutinans Fo5176]EXK76779.1 hypothetical protein FOQG_18490 [Fusarium oxysporum f. sp. raphani 54005]